MLTDEQKKKLAEPLPSVWVKTRDGMGGSGKLSYVEGWRVIDRLNAIFGAGSWSYDCTPHLVSETVDDKKQHRVTYTAKCALRVGDAEIGDWGAGHGIDKNIGPAHESAIKEACTDALKRSAKSLGMSLGLALYDKAQENVSNLANPAEVAACLHEMERAKTAEHVKSCGVRLKMLLGRISAEDEAMLVEAGKQARVRVEGEKR